MLIILSQFPILGHLRVQFSLVAEERVATLSHLSSLLIFELSLRSHDLHELLTVLSGQLFDSGIVVGKLPLAGNVKVCKISLIPLSLLLFDGSVLKLSLFISFLGADLVALSRLILSPLLKIS